MPNQRTPHAAIALLTALVAAIAGPAPASHAEEEVTGKLVVYQADYEGGYAQQIYLLHDSSGQTRELKFNRAPEKALKTGDVIRARGVATGPKEFIAEDDAAIERLSTAPSVAAAVTGQKRALVILLNFTDASQPCTAASVNDTMFGLTNSVDGCYKDASYGKMSWGGDVAGPYTINASTTGACDYNNWATQADQAAASSGFVLSNYGYRVYVLPGSSPCGWIGLGTIGGSPGRSWIGSCSMRDAYAHELGHNLTMHHASEDLDNNGTNDCEYCDTSDFMGYSNVGLRTVNAPHKDQMGWMDAGKMITPAAGGIFELAPLELSSAQTTYTQVLKVPKPGAAGQYYYVSYRRKLGYDSILSTKYADKVNVHRYASGAVQTFFLTALAANGSWTEAGGVTVNTLSVSPSHAVIQLTMPSSTPNPAAPTVTIAPASKSGKPGTAISYSVTVRNNDAAGLAPSTFNLIPSVPSGWSGNLTPAALNLAPGISGTSTLVATSMATSPTGSNQITVQAIDPAVAVHNGAGSATAFVDGVAPTAPASLTAKLSKTQVALKWTASTDNYAVGSYNVYRNGVRITQTTSLSYNDRPGTGTHTYTIRATDQAGNESAAGPGKTVTVR